MGHGGMLYSLPSRELIADAVEYMVNAHCADALVCISNCDKITPGMLIAALRLNIPTVFVSGGPMEAGKTMAIEGVVHSKIDLIDAMSASADDRVTDEQLGAIERAIRDSDLGVNPNNEGTQLRIHLPQMTEERRRDMIKVARTKAEEGRVAIRNVRRKAKEQIDRLVKDGETGEDDGRRAEKELDDVTHRYVSVVDELVKHKEAELLEV